MPYIGKQPISGGFHKLDNLTASATATYALTLGSAAYYPETANQLLVSLNGVIQAPQDSFTVSGSNLIFDSALTASDSIDFVVALGDVLGVGSVTDGAVTTAKIANQAVTMNKLATSGTLPALDGSNLTGVGVAGISSSSTSGTALSIAANNVVTRGVIPSFQAYQAQSISAGNDCVNYTVGHNTGNHFNGTTGVFTCPVNGLYFFQLTVGSNSSYGVDIRKNNSSIRRIEFNSPPGFCWLSTSIIIEMNANDAATAHCFLGTPSMAGGQGGFSGYLIG